MKNTLNASEWRDLVECADLQMHNQEVGSEERAHWEQLKGKLRENANEQYLDDLDAAIKELGIYADEQCENTPVICVITLPSGLCIEVDGAADMWEATHTYLKDLKIISAEYL